MVIKTFEEWWYENHRGMSDEYKRLALEAFGVGRDAGMCMLALRLIKDLKLEIEEQSKYSADLQKGGAR